VTDTHAERVEELGFDQVLQKLRTVVHQLETGSLDLEKTLRIYEEGVNLARRGHSLLDNAEKRVELLVRDSRDSLSAVPFAEAGTATMPATTTDETDCIVDSERGIDSSE
jgi:exodeoxyribonuclease VII small subunit